MHARVSFYDASTEGVDAGIEQFRDVQANVQQMQGNQGGMLLVDRESGQGHHHHVLGFRGRSRGIQRPSE
jgi:hypothetical protein